jgi:D-tyrosyl-tRNA(Tyr) deacylase
VRAVVQRVTEASVSVDGNVIGHIGHGLMVLLGVAHDDSDSDAETISDKLTGLRCFTDEDGKFNLSVRDVGGAILVISQFTLFGDCRKGRRPSFTDAARPELATRLYERVIQLLRAEAIHVAEGSFGAHMHVHLVNDGPVTLLLDSKRLF